LIEPNNVCTDIAGILLHGILGWYVDGTIGGFECALMAGVFLGMVLCIFTLQILPAVLLLAALIFLLILPKIRGRRMVTALHDEQIERFRLAIESDPENLAARGRLAETLYKKGRLDEAIAEYSDLVKRSPQSREEAYRLNQLVQEKEERKAPPIICPSCGHSNPPDRTHCCNCENNLRIAGELKKWLVRGGLRRIAITWAIVMAVIAVVMSALSMLPVVGRILVIALILLVVILAELVCAHRNC
jgi:ribosomal protein L40E